MASAQVVETSVTNNSPSQDSYHPDDLFQSRYGKFFCDTWSPGDHELAAVIQRDKKSELQRRLFLISLRLGVLTRVDFKHATSSPKYINSRIKLVLLFFNRAKTWSSADIISTTEIHIQNFASCFSTVN